MIRFYLDGGVDESVVDFYLLPNGMLVPNYETTNLTLATNIILEVASHGVTAQQMEIIRTFGKTQEVLICFLPN